MTQGWLKGVCLAVLVVAGFFVLARSSDPAPGVLMALIFGCMGWLLGTERRRRHH